METLRTLYEVAVRGGTESEGQLRKVGQVGAEAFQKIDAAAAVVPKSLRAVDAAAATVRGRLDSLAASAGPIGSAFSAIAGPVGLLTVAAGAAGLGFVAMAKRAIESADAIDDSAKSIGIHVEALQALRFAAGQAGIGTESLDGALRTFVKSVGQAEVGTGRFIKFLEKTDEALLQSVQGAGSVEEKLTKVLDAIEKLPSPFQKAALASAAFGAGVGGQIAAVAPELRRLADEARATGIVLTQETIEKAVKAADEFDRLSKILSSQVNSALVEAAPLLGAMAREMGNAAVEAAKLAKNLSDVVFGTHFEGTQTLIDRKLEELRSVQRTLDAFDKDPRPLAPFLPDPSLQTRTRKDELQAEIDQLFKKRDVEKEVADTKRKADTEQQQRAAGEAAELRAQADLQRTLDSDRKSAARAVESSAKRAASEAEASAKRQAAAQASFIQRTSELQAEADEGTLSGIARITAARERSLAEAANDAANGGIDDTALAARNLVIWQQFDNDRKALAQDFADFREGLEIDAANNGLDQTDRLERAYNKLLIAREQGLKSVADMARQTGVVEEEVAAATLAVWQKFENDRARILEAAFDEEIIKQPILSAFADISGLGREALADLFDSGGADAEEFAELARQTNSELFRDIGQMGRQAFHDVFSEAGIDGEALFDRLKSAFLDLVFDMTTQQIILPIVAQVTGAGGGGGAGGIAGGGGGGGGFGGILQTGQQILSAGKTLKSGFDFLTGALGASTVATEGLTGVLAGGLDIGISGIGAITAGTGALAPSVLSGAAIGAGPLTGALGTGVVAPGLIVDASTGAILGSTGAATGATGAAGAAGAGVGLVGGATTAGILVAVVAALEGIMGVINVSKTRDAAFGNADTRKAFMSAFDPITLGVANLTAFIASGQNASNLFAQQQRILFGGADTKDKLQFAASLTATPLGPMLIPLLAFAAFTKPPTKGTALRKAAEEFFENGGPDDDGFGFFARDSGTFKRGIGQTGLSANDVHGGDITAKAREAIGQGARGLQEEFNLDFVVAQQEFIEKQKESIGLTEKQMQQVTGLGAAFRALVGPEAGEEETRVFGVIADFLGSISAEGASAAETMDIVQQAVAGIGRPAVVFEKLNDFFLSEGNDIAVQTYRDAIQGLAAALFNDLPQGVDAAALALDELNKAGNGKVQFEDIAKRVQGAAAEAEALLGGLQTAFTEGIASKQLEDLKADISVEFNHDQAQQALDRLEQLEFEPDDFADNLFDAIEVDLKNAVAQAFFDGIIEGTFKGDILGPFIATLTDVMERVQSGELTPEEGNVILAQATADARDSLETLRPVIHQMVEAGQTLASVFDDVSTTAADVAAAQREQVRAFEKSIDRQILGFLSPQLAAELDQEATARQRLHDARALGLDLNKIARLNELERNAVVEQAAEERINIEKQAADQIERILKSAFEEAERAIKAVADTVNDLIRRPDILPPEVALANAQAQFNDIAARARGGDLEAIQDLPDAGQKLLDAGRVLFGSTERFFAIFNPTLATLQEIAGLDPHTVQLSADARAQIDAINADKNDTLAKMDKHHDEAMALWQAMLDALEISKEGKEIIQTGGGSGEDDHITQGRPGPGSGSSGRYGLGGQQQQIIQGILAAAHPGGELEKALVELLGVQNWDGIQAAADLGGFKGEVANAILVNFPGVHSEDAFDKVITDMRHKIHDPSFVSPILGFDNEGSFTLGGRDTIPLIPGRVYMAPGETATVSRGNLDQKQGETNYLLAKLIEEVRRSRSENAEIRGELASMRQLYQHSVSRSQAERR